MAHKARKKNPIIFSIPNHSGMQEAPKIEETSNGEVPAEASVSETKEHKQWWNNGEKNVLAVECPEGFVPGKMKK